MEPLALSDTDDDHVCRRPDGSPVPAETRTEGECPPERVDVHRRPHALDERYHRRGQGDVVHDRRCDGGKPGHDEYRLSGRTDVLDHDRGDACNDAGLDESTDDDKEPSEEEEGRPLDLLEYLLRRLPAPDEEDRSTDEGHLCRLKAHRRVDERQDRVQDCSDLVVDEEEEDHEEDDGHRFIEERPVGDRRPLVETVERLDHLLLFFGVHLHRATVDEVHHPEEDHHIDHHDGAEMNQELVEGEAGGRTDHDVRRVADECCGPADVGGKDLRHQERNGVEFHHLRDVEEHRREEEDGGDVVEERAHHRGHDRKEDEDPDRAPTREFRCPYRDVLEEAAAACGVDDDHHPDEQEDRSEVDVLEERIPGDDPDEDHDRRTEHGGDRPVDPFVDDERVGEEEDRYRDQCNRIHCAPFSI